MKCVQYFRSLAKLLFIKTLSNDFRNKIRAKESVRPDWFDNFVCTRELSTEIRLPVQTAHFCVETPCLYADYTRNNNIIVCLVFGFWKIDEITVVLISASFDIEQMFMS